MAAKINPRKKALDRISTKIATFLLQDTYTDEGEAQFCLSEAVRFLDKAVVLLVRSDEQHVTKERS